MIEPYKKRVLRASEDAWVYRNLMRTDGKWYSVMQRGLVVGHTRAVCLGDVRFIVRESGRQRVLTSGVKNVHAFVVGRVVPGWEHALIHGANVGRYIPQSCEAFEVRHPLTEQWFSVATARMAHLGPTGLRMLV